MARPEILALLLIIFIGGATGLQFGVNVGDEVDAAHFDLRQLNHSDAVEYRLNVENPASVGCQYRLKGNFYSDGVDTFYSGDSPMFPGEARDLSMMYTATNYTGEVTGQIFLEYCGEEEFIANRTFSMDNPAVEERVSSEVVSVNSSSTRIEIDRNGTLIPVEQPPLWRTGPVEIESGEAAVRYNPPIFQEERNMTFVINDDGENTGYTEISLEEPEETWMEKISGYRNEILLGLLSLVLLSLNIFQAREPILARIKDLK